MKTTKEHKEYMKKYRFKKWLERENSNSLKKGVIENSTPKQPIENINYCESDKEKQLIEGCSLNILKGRLIKLRLTKDRYVIRDGEMVDVILLKRVMEERINELELEIKMI